MLAKLIGILGLGLAVAVFAYQYNKRLLDWLRFQSVGTRDYVVEKLTQMFIEIPPHKILLGMFAMSFGLGSIVFVSLLPQLFPAFMMGIVTTIVGWKAPRPVVDALYRKRVDNFNLQMVDGLNLMSNGLKSGLSVNQSIGLVVQEMPNPLQQEFALVLNENKLGVPLEEALNNLAKRIQCDDVEMFVTSINILKETGGNLAETFDTIAATIRERIKVQKKIQAMTTQGFTQGMFLLSVPLLLGLAFQSQDPEFMKPLITTTLGWVVMLVIFLLEAFAFFVIMKIVKIDV